ncbi:MAG: response regulator transcription factor [Pyrinomonadaceae bacterium]
MSKRLLVVEDDRNLLRAIAVSLRRAGFEVATARCGEEALESLAGTIPDLIVSDIMMPGMDGYTLAAHIRSNARTDLIPVVFLTARDARKDRIAGSRAGVDAYLTKPFEPEELIAAINNILARVARTHLRVARRPNLPSPTGGEGGGSDASVKPDSDLTEAEARIAPLVARGLSNKEIAHELGISGRTVEMHISHILSKKGWSNRIEIARYVFEGQPPE